MQQELIDRLRSGAIATLAPGELADLLSQAEVITEQDTFHSGMIRILRFERCVLVQETTDSDKIIARLRPTLDEARIFVQRRMETYERIWDTCGLRVSYFDD
jgi:hypothetical protein